MTTCEMIVRLRSEAEWYRPVNPDMSALLNAAADKIEELDERVAIMMEDGGDDSFDENV